MACVPEGLDVEFHFILMNLNLNSYRWLVAAILDDIGQCWKHSEKVQRAPPRAGHRCDFSSLKGAVTLRNLVLAPPPILCGFTTALGLFSAYIPGLQDGTEGGLG